MIPKDSDNARWEQAYRDLDWKEKGEIDDIAERHGLTTIEAMKKRFKWNINVALTGKMPPDWVLYSPEEQRAIQQTLQDPETVDRLKKLMAWADVDPDSIKIEDDPEMKNWKKRNG